MTGDEAHVVDTGLLEAAAAELGEYAGWCRETGHWPPSLGAALGAVMSLSTAVLLLEEESAETVTVPRCPDTPEGLT